MKTFLFFFLYCYIGFSLLNVRGADQSSVQVELSSLLSIKASLVDSSNFLSNWTMPADGGNAAHCSWTGVSCNSEGFVQKLDLSNMDLSGSLSEHIQGLHSLSHLNICCNAFSTPLPKSLFDITTLQVLDVSSNDFIGGFLTGLGRASGLTAVNASSNNFSGFLPEDLGNATTLQSLDFRGSYYEGSIPSSFKNLKKLKFLGLSGNNLTGPIPPELGQLESLETMIMGYNEFQGEIPAEFGNLTNLQYLDLAVGTLSGQIPPELGKLQKLATLFLYRNNFGGKIPAEIGNISSLVFLDLSDNQISGKIPAEIAGLENLQLLNLMCNQLTGQIPRKLGQLTKLEILALWQNSLTGPLPDDLGQKSPLKWLDVSTNSLSGEIPPGLCSNGVLTKLILFNNSFSGPIPVGLSNCTSLVRVRAQNNLISGNIPVGLGSLGQLQRLELAYNRLTGGISDDITLSTSLSFIDLSYNHLESFLPRSIFSIPSLQTFIATNNNFNGTMPGQFQDSPSMNILDLSNNYLSGNIPKSISSCEKLVNLNLSSNQFTGEIPNEIATLPTLSILDLSNNSLVGRIPEDFGSSPALEMLNLSYNKLEGPVPTAGILMTINPNDLIGNAGLCDGAFPPCSPHSSKSASRPNNVHISRAIIGFVAGLSTVLVLVIAAFAGRGLYRRWYLHGTFYTDWFSKSTGEWPWRLVAFQRLNFTSADILSSIKESNLVGRGGAGMVYKAETHRPHSIVAVKKLWKTSTPDIEAGDNLLKEVNLLGRLRHRNVVRLLGYLHNQSEVMMLYEYMPNGNLGAALHSKESGKLLVDWVCRYNIAVGVAQGLNYLHNDCHPPVIHRDIKSNNILLDAQFDARIADFGLARMLSHKNETLSMVAGSYGYIAPEYGYTLKVDEKIDIYSYGVVLLELLTGKMPLDPSFEESLDIVEWVRLKIRDNRAVEDVLDPNLAGRHCKYVQEEMLLVLRIALLCTAKLPKDRPSMRDIITMLGEAKPRRKSVCEDAGRNADKEKPIFTTSPASGII